MIGVVGDGAVADRVVAGLADAGVDAVPGPAPEVVGADVEAIVAVGEPALLDLVAAGVKGPVLPVGLAAGLPSVPAEAVPATIGRYRAGTAETRQHPLLGVAADGHPVGRAVFDAMLVRSEPGRISEYSLAADEAASRFRADGVVVATPAGSHGYAHAAGGPRLGLDAAAVVVLPVAAFGLGAPTWVLDPEEGLELRVERDEGDVSLLVDGRERRVLAGPSAVGIRAVGRLDVVELPSGD